MSECGKVLNVCDKVFESFDGAFKYYTSGGCFQFHLILLFNFKEAAPYYDGNHIITKIGKNYFDINGIYDIPKGKVFIHLNDMHPRIHKDAYSWAV